MRQQSRETRQKIFEACSRILQTDGLTNLTLESVAGEAGLSKGGLLYHFPNKETLVEALFEYHNNIFETRLQELAEAEGNETGAWLRAYAKASIEQISDLDNASLYAGLFAAEERYASAHQLMRQKYINWQQQVENCDLDPTLATLVRLAVDGLWFSEMHRYAPPDLECREQIIQLIMNMTYGSEP
ncbi:MAG: TetR/AcrR family transcriptional regulator [Chloroflexi bacterium]|nr:TetR/AcrR family transcriptional regulator [Chloroflexota bacterium]